MSPPLILAGGGHAHLAVLEDWAANPLPGPLPDIRRLLVTPSRYTAYSGMVPGWMAGIYRADDLLIDLEPLARAACAELRIDRVTGLDADARRLHLASGDVVDFALLSLATGGEADLDGLAPLGPRLLPLRPVAGFLARWPALVDAAKRGEVASLAVVGGGAAGMEIALAAEAALRGCGVAIALVTPPDGLLTGHNPRVRAMAKAELARRGIALHLALATGKADGLALSDGTHVFVDRVIAATGSRAPAWLAQSGLALTRQGFVAIGPDLRSLSHPVIFAAGDLAQRTDRALPRSGVHAVKAGPVLAANLRAALTSAPGSRYTPRRHTLYLLATGDKRAIGSWGPLAFSGRAAWWLKDWIDRSFVGRYRVGKTGCGDPK
ncbi:FAD-dependent oxidoreductase [Alteraurantiacibacter palmitatis]|uniref:FAD-dependent oxidoreductase n=1 Tax=Alteraurantiacibacter palmitatis TaxID=2054628 RepID=A0ABV7E6T6_9SPHN